MTRLTTLKSCWRLLKPTRLGSWVPPLPLQGLSTRFFLLSLLEQLYLHKAAFHDPHLPLSFFV